MNQIPKIDCSWHGVQTGTETEFGVYKCPKCLADPGRFSGAFRAIKNLYTLAVSCTRDAPPFSGRLTEYRRGRFEAYQEVRTALERWFFHSDEEGNDD